MYTYIHVYIYIYIYIYIHTHKFVSANSKVSAARLATRRRLDGAMLETSVRERNVYGQFSEFQICFCGPDPGNLKFETVRTHKQRICF